MIYKGILKKRTQQKNILILVACAVFLFLEYQTKQYFYIPFTILAMVAVFHEKEHIVSEEGVNIKRSIFGITSNNLWKWDEITALQPDYIKFRPHAQLLIEKNTMLRPFLFTPEEVEEIIALARKMNPDIYVDYSTESEQEEIERKNEQYKMQQRDLKEKAKANAKKKKRK